MNAIQIHLMLNHIPVLLPLLAALLVATGLAFRSQPVLRVALGLLLLAALMAIPVYLSGEPVERATEGLTGVMEGQIDAHEGTALVSLILVLGLGLLAAAGLGAYRHRPIPGRVGVAYLMGTLLVAGQIAWTAHLGGQIRHTELRNSAATAAPVDVAGEDE